MTVTCKYRSDIGGVAALFNKGDYDMSKKRILIVVDMQNDFISGSLGSQAAKDIVPAVAEKIESYNKPGDAVVFTKDTHFEDYMQTREGRHLPVEHCINDTYGWEFAEEIEEVMPQDAKIIEKNTFGAFSLVELLMDLAVEETVFELVGLCTEICVISNALMIRNAFCENEICVDSKCCAGVTEESHRAALAVMASCHINIA